MNNLESKKSETNKSESPSFAPLSITDTTLRDVYQIYGVQVPLEEELYHLARYADEVGFSSVEAWGGISFDIAVRYLSEDPWQHLQSMKKIFQKTPLKALLRGQNAVGYHHQPDDVLKAFIEQIASYGVDIIRTFDPLNDLRNLEPSITYSCEAGMLVEGTIIYARSPYHCREKYIEVAMQLKKLGVQSIVLQDIAGILVPAETTILVKELKESTGLPIHLHCYSGGGMATMNYLAAAIAGVDGLDCSSSAYAVYSYQPSIEVILEALGTASDRIIGLSRPALEAYSKEAMALSIKKVESSPTRVLYEILCSIHRLPGSVLSFVIEELEKQNALDRIDDVLNEVKQVREELGSPPLITPCSQIVASQAIWNCLTGKRYGDIPKEVKHFITGWYGKTPGPIREDLKKRILKETESVTVRPASLLKPKMREIREKLSLQGHPLMEDALLYALFPAQAFRFFEEREKGEKNREKEPSGTSSPDFLETESDFSDLSLVEKVYGFMSKNDLEEISVQEGENTIRLVRDPGSKEMVLPSGFWRQFLSSESGKEVLQNSGEKSFLDQKKEKPGAFVLSPIVGTFYAAASPGEPPFISEGDEVKEDTVVCIVEAMKLFNEITAGVEGQVAEILVKNEQVVQNGEKMFRIV